MLVCFHRLRGAAWQNFVIHSEFIFKLQTIFHILIKGKNALVQFLNVSKATHSRCYLMAFSPYTETESYELEPQSGFWNFSFGF